MDPGITSWNDVPISSLENPQVRLARSLLTPAGRQRHGAFLVEGLRLVEAAVAGAVPWLVLYVPPFGQHTPRERRLRRTLRRLGCPVRPVTGQVMAQVTATVTPQGIAAVLPLPDGGAPRPPGEGEAALILVLDAV